MPSVGNTNGLPDPSLRTLHSLSLFSQPSHVSYGYHLLLLSAMNDLFLLPSVLTP